MDAQAQKAVFTVERAGEKLVLRLSGVWKLGCGLPDIKEIENLPVEGEGYKSITFDTSGIVGWDSGLMTFLIKVLRFCQTNDIQFDQASLSQDLSSLLSLSQAVPEKEGLGEADSRGNYFHRLGKVSIGKYEEMMASVSFVGECFQSVLGLLKGRRPFRWRDFYLVVQEVGFDALPIVALISFLVGLIISFLGAVVLQRFGADVYVSYLVAYGMLREMGALMTGIIMAGRTGAAFAAQIGSMKVTEEIDALRTLGISPIDFIVLPRMLALFLMMPLLSIYAAVIGMFSGMLISNIMMDIAFPIFLNGMKEAVALPDFFLGVFKGTVFGVIVAVSGCLKGMRCGDSADAVGLAATSAVVTGITFIIISNAMIDWVAAIYGM